MDQGKRVGWLVWIYYQEPAPAERELKLTLGTSGFTVEIYVAKDNEPYEPHPDINASTGIVQTQGTDDENKPDHSIQFFVSTKDYEGKYGPSLKIKIVVTGLTDYIETFTLPDTTVDIGTIQTTSLEDGD